MKVIDFERKGNVFRLYLGKDDCNDYWGDDWNDAPYEHNAGEVYDRYVSGIIDFAAPLDYLVLEPANDYSGNSQWSKEDMKQRKIPCLIIVPKEVYGDSWDLSQFKTWVGADGTIRIYYEDSIRDIATKYKCLEPIFIKLNKEEQNEKLF